MQIAGSFSTISAAKARANLGVPAKTGDTYTGQHFIPLAAPLKFNFDITKRIEGGVYSTGNASTTMGWPENSNSYSHLLSCSYAAESEYCALQIAGGFFDNDNFFVRKVQPSGTQPWRKLWHDGNFPAPTVLADLADVKKRLDQPWGNPVTYYGAERSWTKDSSAAFQTAASLGYINVPGGDFIIDNPIVTTAPVVMQGAGQHALAGSRLLARVPGLNMFMHNAGAPLGEAYNESFVVRGVNFCTMAEGVERACNVRLSDASCIMTDVAFTSWSGAFHFRNFVKLSGGPVFNKFTRIQGNGNSFNPAWSWDKQTWIGFDIQSDSPPEKTFGVVFDNCDITAIQHGVLATINGGGGANGSVEGVIFRDCFGRTAKGPWYRLYAPESSSFWYAPYHAFERVNYEGPGQVADIDAAAEVHVDQCLFYGGEPVADSTRVPDDFFRVRRFQTMHFTRNTVMLYDKSEVSYCLSLSGGGDGLWVRDNTFQANAGSKLNGGVYLAAGSVNVQPASGNIFRNWPNGLTKFNGMAVAA